MALENQTMVRRAHRIKNDYDYDHAYDHDRVLLNSLIPRSAGLN